MPTITNRRLADQDHAVITIEGDPSRRFRRSPCQTCPWRKDAVGEFPAEAFRLSANTGTDAGRMMEVTDVNEALHTFGCHSSGPGKPQTCAGYVLNGDASLGWRVAHSRNRFSPYEVSTDVELFDSYYDMAVANGVHPDDPAIALCRPMPMPSFDQSRVKPPASETAPKSPSRPKGKRQARQRAARK